VRFAESVGVKSELKLLSPTASFSGLVGSERGTGCGWPFAIVLSA